MWTDNLTAMDRFAVGASEFCGTIILVFLGCMACVKELSNGFIPLQQTSLSFGLAAMLSIATLGQVSGSHINPILTIAAFILGHLALIELPIYFIGQFSGAIAGYALLMAVTPYCHQAEFSNTTDPCVTKLLGVCSPAVNPELTSFQGLLVEFLASFMLTLLLCAVWDSRNATLQDSAALKVGLCIAVLLMTAGPYTGGHFNPARSFAPAVWHGDWKDHWLYWVGPILASIAAAGIYRIMFQLPKDVEL